MLNRFKWYRKWKGGYWINHVIMGWYQVSCPTFSAMQKHYVRYPLVGRELNAMEDWTND